MVQEQELSQFKQRLVNLPEIGNVALARVYDNQTNNLLTVVPNLPGSNGSLRVFSAYNDEGIINPEQALDCFGSALQAQAQGNKHPNIQLLQRAQQEGRTLRTDFVKTEQSDVLDALMQGSASPEQKLEGLQLLQRGQIRTAEKTYGVRGEMPLWEPQAYAIATVNAGFGLFSMGMFPNDPTSFDKIPLWQQQTTLIDGVNSPYLSEEQLEEFGVRFIPGSFARIGTYIGKGTTLMPGAIANIGAYITGEGVMIDGGSRVGSGAQVGKAVKLGAGSGLEGVLEPAGMMPTIVEDGVRVGANCELTGIIGANSLIASGVVMSSGKKIFDERTREQVEPLYVETAQGIRPVPHIPQDRVAVSATYTPEGSRFGKNIILLLEKSASESDFMHVPKNASLYQR